MGGITLGPVLVVGMFPVQRGIPTRPRDGRDNDGHFAMSLIDSAGVYGAFFFLDSQDVTGVIVSA